jgi:GTP cyclohydrolase I
VKDVQSERDTRNLPINKVGINQLSFPISVLDRSGKPQHTIARINMYVDLPHHYRGTHMSRFIEVISRHNINLKQEGLDQILKDMRKTFNCETSHLELEFPYFIYKKAPVSKIESPMEYICRVEAKLGKSEKLELIIEVDVPVHSLCPCSKEISSEGAHNQRGVMKIRVIASKMVWFEELIDIAEKSASAPLFTLLKREDEKYITEMAYQNPRFVEDAARDVVTLLNQDNRILWYSVEVTNFESIHNHNAYAYIEKENKNAR